MGARFAAQMQERAEAERAAERAKIRGRRGKATEFVDKEIRALIGILQQKPNRQDLFGNLFKETMETFGALAATLAVAKKRGVVSYDGIMLMQGINDGVVITLLRDEIEDTAVFVSTYVRFFPLFFQHSFITIMK